MRSIRAWSACVPAIFVFHGSAFAQAKGLELVHQPGWIESDHDVEGVRDYAWKGYPRYHAGTRSMLADDVHRVTNDPIVALSVGMRCNDGLGDYSVRLRIFENDSRNELYPSEEGLLWDGTFHGLPDASQGMMRLEFPEPVSAPKDIWIGLLFSRVAGNDRPSLLVPDLNITDQVGWSENLVLSDTDDGDLIPTGAIWANETNFSFMMEVYSQPGSLPAPGASVVLGVITLSAFRRRRSA